MNWLMTLGLMASFQGDYGPTEIRCASASLWAFAAMSGKALPVANVNEALQDNSPEGSSLSEIIEASGRLGIRLTAKKLGASDALPSEPFIALLQPFGPNRPGHYVAARRIAGERSRLQVFDFPDEPIAVDSGDWRANSGFTGWILMESGAPLSLRPYGIALICLGVAVLGRRRWMPSVFGRPRNKTPSGDGARTH